MQPAAVTGIGSWPGVDVQEVARVIRDTCQELPHIGELPQRGPGADMIGRTAALVSLVSTDFSVETSPTGWRLARSRGRDLRRADAFWDEDLDVVEEIYQGYEGDFKVQLVGPWTLAANLELVSGDRLLRDRGVCRELSVALAQTAQDHVKQIQQRIPGANIILQIDEPSLPAVMNGEIKTQSGWGAYTPPELHEVEIALSQVTTAHSGFTMLHSCAPNLPFGLVTSAGFKAISIDASLYGPKLPDVLGEQSDAGNLMALGISAQNVKTGIEFLRTLASQIGFSTQTLAQHVLLSPPCGLISMSLSQARETIEMLNLISRALREVDS